MNSGEIKRDFTLDYLRAFLIILVVFGHSLQYGLGVEYRSFCDNIVVKAIYSFHMPLFMMISGYLFGFTVKRHSFKEILINKTKSLLIPVAVWSIPITFIDIIKYDSQRMNPWDFFKTYLSEFLGAFWFLWAVFLCSVTVLLVNKFLKDHWLVYAAVFLATFFIPVFIANDELYRFMYPFYIIGCFFGKKEILSGITNRLKNFIGLVSLIVFITLLLFYNYDSYIYNSGHSLIGKENWLHQLFIDFYRIIIGLSGSVFFWGFFNTLSIYIKGKASIWLSYLGANTIGVYIISFFISVYALPELIKENQGLNYLLALLETLATITVCLVLIIAIKRVKVLNRLLLGGR